MDNILEEVKKIQIYRVLNDRLMAELLGYKQRENWTRIKGGRAPVTKYFIDRAIKAFPELASTYDETSQDSKRGWLRWLLDKILRRG